MSEERSTTATTREAQEKGVGRGKARHEPKGASDHVVSSHFCTSTLIGLTLNSSYAQFCTHADVRNHHDEPSSEKNGGASSTSSWFPDGLDLAGIGIPIFLTDCLLENTQESVYHTCSYLITEHSKKSRKVVNEARHGERGRQLRVLRYTHRGCRGYLPNTPATISHVRPPLPPPPPSLSCLTAWTPDCIIRLCLTLFVQKVFV